MLPAHSALDTGRNEQAILVVDDEIRVRVSLARYLTGRGYRVFEPGNVAEAKAVVNAKAPIDLVFSDVNMPGDENGFALARWLRQHHPNIKVLLTSGIWHAGWPAGNLRPDAPVLAKPYSVASLLQRIQGLLRQAKEKPS